MAASVVRDIPWQIELLSPSAAAPRRGWLRDLIGKPPDAVASELKSRDFVFLTKSAIEDRTEAIAAAECLIDQVPSLSAVTRAIVRDVFLLSAREEYDVSHSEPRWPGWIFVSAPRSSGIVPALRFAENVVHEAMHLQLTEVEARMPLIENTESKLPSPWKQEPRDLQGILHGLYVFTCIAAFLTALLDGEALPDEGAAHVHRRIASIRGEVATLPLDRLAEGLTEAGRHFLASIRR